MDEVLEVAELAADSGLEGIITWILRAIGILFLITGLGMWLLTDMGLFVIPAALLAAGVLFLIAPGILLLLAELR
jgi:hypothetical protein